MDNEWVFLESLVLSVEIGLDTLTLNVVFVLQ